MDIKNANDVLDKISDNISYLTLFKLLLVYEQLLDLISNYRTEINSIKNKKNKIENALLIEIANNKEIKTIAKKAYLDIAKSNNVEYTALDIKHKELQQLIERIENLIKIVDRKYKLIEPAFHSNGVQTYNELESEHQRWQTVNIQRQKKH